MPLDNAESISPRVYKLLKNTTLDDINGPAGAAIVGSVGDPMSIEQLDEDEMRRLVLVMLARLTCAAEWRGLFNP